MRGFFVLPTGQRSAVVSARAQARRRSLHRVTTLGLVAAALLVMLAAGCGQSSVIEVNQYSFRSVVLLSQRPVLVNFYKPG